MLKVIKRLLGIKKIEWVKELGIYSGILMGDYDGVKTYYNSGHDVNKHLEGYTPLGIAALNGQAKWSIEFDAQSLQRLVGVC